MISSARLRRLWGADSRTTRPFVLGVLALAVSAWAAPASATPPHPVYNGMRYANASYFDQYGAVPITTVYDVWGMSCTSKSCTNIPTRAQFDSTIHTYVSQFRSSSPIILDFEHLVVSVATSTSQARQQVTALTQLVGWAHQDYPSAQVGLYDYDWSPTYANSTYVSIRKQLYGAGGLDFFAPTMYQRWSTATDWDANLTAAIANDARVGALPSIAYVSPYIAGDTASGLQSSADWAHQLSSADSQLSGAIVWTACAPTDTLDTAQAWVQDVVSYLTA